MLSEILGLLLDSLRTAITGYDFVGEFSSAYALQRMTNNK